MDDRVSTAIQALPDGEAELTLVVRLPWEDVARLGQEAGRLASRMRRPVTLDEAVAHRLRSARPTAAHAKPAGEQPPAAAGTAGTGAAGSAAAGGTGASVSPLPPRPATEYARPPVEQARPPAEQARQAIERINGTA